MCRRPSVADPGGPGMARRRLGQPARHPAEHLHRRVVLLRVEDQTRPARRGRRRHVDPGDPELRLEGAVVGDAVAFEEQRATETLERHRRHLERPRSAIVSADSTNPPLSSHPSGSPSGAGSPALPSRVSCSAENARCSRRKARPRTGADHRTRSSIRAPRPIAAAVRSPPRPSPMAATADTPGTAASHEAAIVIASVHAATSTGSPAVPPLSPVPGKSIRRVG